MKPKDTKPKVETGISYQRENELLEKVWKRVASEEPVASNVFMPAPDAPSKPVAPDWEKQILAFIADEYADARYYHRMAQRYQACSPVFSTIGAEELRHAKRLSTLLFLRAGIRIPASKKQHPKQLPDYCDALRIRILAEQEGAVAYQAAGEQAPDETLRQLYIELAEDEREHARTLQTLLERAI
ncbi:MAG: ferritin-like domain-containing protein [Oscillospiraceae bacterium]|nr:ferritin-like domain-containing protein [Oscillospiraceae bacterium]